MFIFYHLLILLIFKYDSQEGIEIETEPLNKTEDLITFDVMETPLDTIENEPSLSDKDHSSTELSLAMATEPNKYSDYSHKGSKG